MGHDPARLCTTQRRAVPCRAITHSKTKFLKTYQFEVIFFQTRHFSIQIRVVKQPFRFSFGFAWNDFTIQTFEVHDTPDIMSERTVPNLSIFRTSFDIQFHCDRFNYFNFSFVGTLLGKKSTETRRLS